MDHILIRWAEINQISITEIAKEAGCSQWHLRNILAGRRTPSLAIAKRLSDITKGVVPMDSFLSKEAC
jgi:hypothetical protein